MPKLIVLIGAPGTGKSTWRNQYTARNPNAVVVSQDDLVDAYAAENGVTYSVAFREAPLKEFAKIVRESFTTAISENRDIILDRTNMSAKTRASFVEAAQKKGYETQAVVFECHPVVLEDRLARRAKETGKFIPPGVVKSMLASYQEPTLFEFDQVSWIRTDQPTLMQQVRHIMREARKLLP